jgi:dihydroflavonol-4-reductase
MKIFITGGTGFIGTHLVERLAETEHQAHCLVRKNSNLANIEKFNASYVIGDINDKQSLLEGMKGCDWVVNLANVYTLWEPDRQIYRKINVEGTKNVMEAALDTGIAKVLHVSTNAIYGKPEEVPFTEESTVGSTRFSEYARTKYAGDLIAWKLYEEENLPLVVIYPGIVLGPGDSKPSGNYINDLIHQRLPATAFNDSVLTYVYVKDVAEVILKALEKQNNIGEKYLVGKHRLPYREYNQLISEISGVPLPKMSFPDFFSLINATFMTGLASLTKKPPIWGLSLETVRMNIQGQVFDGSKAERELGITYTPIRVALEEAIASFRQ